jgi:hypothetical protein
MRWEQHAHGLLRPSAPIVERLCAPPTRSAASSGARTFFASAVYHSIGLSMPGQASPLRPAHGITEEENGVALHVKGTYP